jgi:hypothetical protein
MVREKEVSELMSDESRMKKRLIRKELSSVERFVSSSCILIALTNQRLEW